MARRRVVATDIEEVAKKAIEAKGFEVSSNGSVSLSREDREDILMNDVAPIVVDILKKHIQEDIYDAWEPTVYHRRYSLEKNIICSIDDDGELFVTSVAPPAPPHLGWSNTGEGSFLYMLEVGNMGWWKKGFPRPAISLAQKEVDNSTEIEAAIQAGIKRVMEK